MINATSSLRRNPSPQGFVNRELNKVGTVTAEDYAAAKLLVTTNTNLVTILGLGTFERASETVTGASAGSPESANEHDPDNGQYVFEISTGVFKLFRKQVDIVVGKTQINVRNYGLDFSDFATDVEALDGVELVFPAGTYTADTDITLTGKTKYEINISENALINIQAGQTGSNVYASSSTHKAMIVFRSCAKSGVFGKGKIDGQNVDVSAIGHYDGDDMFWRDFELYRVGGLASIVSLGSRRTRAKRLYVHDGPGTTRGIKFGSVASSAEQDYDIEVEYCRVEDMGATGIVCISIRGFAKNNESHRNAGSGIIQPGETPARCESMLFEGNRCSGNTFSGLQVDVFSGGLDETAWPTGLQFINNHCWDNVIGGIELTYSKNVLTQGNHFYNNVNGIRLGSGRAHKILGNFCYDNRSSDKTQVWGLKLDPLNIDGVIFDEIEVGQNSLHGNSQYGIGVSGSATYAIGNGLELWGNLVKDNGARGIWIVNKINALLRANKISGHSEYDLRATPDVGYAIKNLDNRYATANLNAQVKTLSLESLDARVTALETP